MKQDFPDRIYLFDNPVLDFSKLSERQSDNDVEYTRTDAFIKKACEFLKKEVLDDYAGIVWEGLIEDFKNYMKGE